MARNLVLTAAQSECVERLIGSGQYRSAHEAVDAGLRLLQQQESDIAALRSRLQSGVRQAQSGDLAQGSGIESIRRAFSQAREP